MKIQPILFVLYLLPRIVRLGFEPKTLKLERRGQRITTIESENERRASIRRLSWASSTYLNKTKSINIDSLLALKALTGNRSFGQGHHRLE